MAELVRHAEATWIGTLRDGRGRASTGSGALVDVAMNFVSRFESGSASNPEELIGAAHATCFSMALAAGLAREGHPPEEIHTRADVVLTMGEGGPRITAVHLSTEARVPGLDQSAFQQAADLAKAGCPVSLLLEPGLERLTLEARLLG